MLVKLFYDKLRASELIGFLMNKYKVLALFCVLAGVVGHLLYIAMPTTNLEWVFVEASKSILNPSYAIGMQSYWFNEANPLGYSLVIAGVSKIMHLSPSLIIARGVSLFGYVLILLAAYLWHCQSKQMSVKQMCWWVWLVTLNPMLWIYTGTASADIFPLGLLMLSVSICYVSRNRAGYLILSSLIYGASLSVKYHGGLFVFAFLYIIYLNANKKISLSLVRSLFVFSLPGLVVLAGYFVYLYLSFHVLVITSKFGHIYTPSLVNFVTNFVSYSSFLMLSLGPLSLMPLIVSADHHTKKQNIVLCVVLLVFMAVAPFAFDHRQGEMNYGAFDYILPQYFFKLINVAGIALFVVLVYQAIFSREDGRNSRVLFLLTILPYIAICSLVRPSQRYLMFLQPVMYLYFIYISRNIRWAKWFVVASVILFVAGIVPSVVYRSARGHAEENVYHWLIQHKLLETTNPGFLSGRYGFPFRNHKKKWVVVTRRIAPKRFIYEEKMTLMGHLITNYYVVPVSEDVGKAFIRIK